MTIAPKGDRGDLTREKLLTGAVDVFGRYGFDGATTRMLSEAAGVNQQAIPYYFGGKEGLYLATADFIGAAIGQHISPLRERIRARLQDASAAGGAVDADEARTLLVQIVQTLAAMLVSDESESWARFIIREQMEPTAAFRRVYDGVMSPLLDVAASLVGIMLGEDPHSEHVRLRTLSLIGSILVFRMAHAAVLAKLEWQVVGPRELSTIQALAVELVATLGTGRPIP